MTDLKFYQTQAIARAGDPLSVVGIEQLREQSANAHEFLGSWFYALQPSGSTADFELDTGEEVTGLGVVTTGWTDEEIQESLNPRNKVSQFAHDTRRTGGSSEEVILGGSARLKTDRNFDQVDGANIIGYKVSTQDLGSQFSTLLEQGDFISGFPTNRPVSSLQGDPVSLRHVSFSAHALVANYLPYDNWNPDLNQPNPNERDHICYYGFVHGVWNLASGDNNERFWARQQNSRTTGRVAGGLEPSYGSESFRLSAHKATIEPNKHSAISYRSAWTWLRPNEV